MLSQMIPPTVKLHVLLVLTDVVKLEQIIVVDLVLSGQLPQLLDASTPYLMCEQLGITGLSTIKIR